MTLKKIISIFTITAILSVFSCSIIFLWNEFSSHVIIKNDVCLVEQHCFDDCIICGASKFIFQEKKVLSTDERKLKITQFPNLYDYSGDNFIYSKNALLNFPSLNFYLRKSWNKNSYALAHNRIKNIVLIL